MAQLEPDPTALPAAQHKWTARKGDARRYAWPLARRAISSRAILPYILIPVGCLAAGITTGKPLACSSAQRWQAPFGHGFRDT